MRQLHPTDSSARSALRTNLLPDHKSAVPRRPAVAHTGPLTFLPPLLPGLHRCASGISWSSAPAASPTRSSANSIVRAPPTVVGLPMLPSEQPLTLSEIHVAMLSGRIPILTYFKAHPTHLKGEADPIDFGQFVRSHSPPDLALMLVGLSPLLSKSVRPSSSAPVSCRPAPHRLQRAQGPGLSSVPVPEPYRWRTVLFCRFTSHLERTGASASAPHIERACPQRSVRADALIFRFSQPTSNFPAGTVPLDGECTPITASIALSRSVRARDLETETRAWLRPFPGGSHEISILASLFSCCVWVVLR